MDLLSSIEDLGQKVRREQDAFLSSSDDSDQGREDFLVRASQLPREPHRRRSLLLAAVVLVSLTGIGLFIGLRRPWGDAPLVFLVGTDGQYGAAGNFVAAPEKRSLALSFSDGTVVNLAPRTRARVMSLESSRPELVLESGRAEYRVKHRASAEWRMSSGPFTVHVVGTEFGASWEPSSDSFEITMRQGEVRVSGCLFGDVGRPLLAGETLKASCSARRFEVTTQKEGTTRAGSAPVNASSAFPSATALNAPEPGAGGQEPVLPASKATGALAADPGAPSNWAELARRGKFSDAFLLLQDLGFNGECERVSVGDLALLADVARYVGRRSEARTAYLALRRRFPGTPQSATAAYSLGRMAFDGTHAYTEASRWFQRYLQEQPGGALAREALGRLLESKVQTHNSVGARSVASQYLSSYPNGPHAGLAREIVSDASASGKRGH